MPWFVGSERSERYAMRAASDDGATGNESCAEMCMRSAIVRFDYASHSQIVEAVSTPLDGEGIDFGSRSRMRSSCMLLEVNSPTETS